MAQSTEQCDVLVVGTGAAGLTAAVCAGKAGMKVIVVEKEALIGGTTAFSGGVIWIPGSRHSLEEAARAGTVDSAESGRKYICGEGGKHIDPALVDAFVKYGPEMVDYLERETEVKFYGMYYPDYVSENPHSHTYRSLGTVNYQTSRMGAHLKNLRNLLPQTLFFGLAIGSTVEINHFMRAGRSLTSFFFVLKKMAGHARDMLLYGRSEQMVRGRALIGRLVRTAMDLEIPIWLSSPAKELLVNDGRVSGAVISTPQGDVRVAASRAVILASGGYANDPVRRAATYPRLANGEDHPTPVPPGNTGDGLKLAERAGARFVKDVSEVAPWMPVSRIPGSTGVEGVWPHFVDRQKPGFIVVSRSGRRFADESCSYHHFVPRMIAASEAEGEAEAIAWLVADHRAVNRSGMGFARPFPVPRGHYVRKGYLLRANTLAELAVKAGIDANGLEATVRAFNGYAKSGVDPQFGRGGRTYDISQGDDQVKPNPCLAPLATPPFYAVRLYAAEIGSFAGIKTDACARALDEHNRPIPGLYVVGNDQASVFGGAYPGAGATLGPGMTFGYIAGRHAAGVHT